MIDSPQEEPQTGRTGGTGTDEFVDAAIPRHVEDTSTGGPGMGKSAQIVVVDNLPPDIAARARRRAVLRAS